MNTANQRQSFTIAQAAIVLGMTPGEVTHHIKLKYIDARMMPGGCVIIARDVLVLTCVIYGIQMGRKAA